MLVGPRGVAARRMDHPEVRKAVVARLGLSSCLPCNLVILCASTGRDRKNGLICSRAVPWVMRSFTCCLVERLG